MIEIHKGAMAAYMEGLNQDERAEVAAAVAQADQIEALPPVEYYNLDLLADWVGNALSGVVLELERTGQPLTIDSPIVQRALDMHVVHDTLHEQTGTGTYGEHLEQGIDERVTTLIGQAMQRVREIVEHETAASTQKRALMHVVEVSKGIRSFTELEDRMATL